MALDRNSLNSFQQTGLQQLGDTLLKGSADYANIKMRRDAEERARMRQLADLADQRDYAERKQLSDREYAEKQKNNDRLYAEQLVLNGIARAAALEEVASRRERINALVAKGLLTMEAADADDEAKILEASAVDQGRTQEAYKQGQEQRVARQEEADRLGAQADDLNEKINETQRKLDSIPRQPAAPSERAILIRAREMAAAAKEDVKSQEVIARYAQAARAELEAKANQIFALSLEVADDYKISLQADNARLNRVSMNLASLASGPQAVSPRRKPPANPAGSLQSSEFSSPEVTHGGAAPASAAGSATTGDRRAFRAAPQAPSLSVDDAPEAGPTPSSQVLSPNAPIDWSEGILGVGRQAMTSRVRPSMIPSLGQGVQGIDQGLRTAYGNAKGFMTGDFSSPKEPLLDSASAMGLAKTLGGQFAPSAFALESLGENYSPARKIQKLPSLYPLVPDPRTGGQREMTDTEKAAYDYEQQIKKSRTAFGQ